MTKSRYERPSLPWDARTIGVDEAGRGPLAGPVVAAAVLLDCAQVPPGINDSKQLSPKCREDLFTKITLSAAYGIGIVGPRRIDRVNILNATMTAMGFAVARLMRSLESGKYKLPKPVRILIDGNRIPTALSSGVHSNLDTQAIIGGDRSDCAIAAASIVAKVTRDRLMHLTHARYPIYGFGQHKGYPTLKHRAAIMLSGPCAAHRQTFNLAGTNKTPIPRKSDPTLR